MDQVFIEGLKVKGKHGVHDSERRVEQEFEFSVRMAFDTKPAGKSDDLPLALNYALVYQMIKRVTKRNKFYLIERLGEVICSNILKDKRIEKVELTVKKTAIWPDAIPGVVIVRTQSRT